MPPLSPFSAAFAAFSANRFCFETEGMVMRREQGRILNFLGLELVAKTAATESNLTWEQQSNPASSYPVVALPMSASRNDERYSYVDFPTCTVADAAPGPSRLSTSRHETAVFPPAAKEDATSSANAATRRFSMSIPSTSISTNVSDLLLASLLPPNLPRLPAPKNEGRVRQLTTQREGLGVNLLSNNFRRFVTRVSGASTCLPSDGSGTR